MGTVRHHPNGQWHNLSFTAPNDQNIPLIVMNRSHGFQGTPTAAYIGKLFAGSLHSVTGSSLLLSQHL
jgi:hypothetical protein